MNNMQENELKVLKNKIAKLEKTCDILQQQLNISLRTIAKLEKADIKNTIEFIAIGLCLVYLLLTT